MATQKLDEEAIFQVARKIDSPQARADYLAQVCGDDQALRRLAEAARMSPEEFRREFAGVVASGAIVGAGINGGRS